MSFRKRFSSERRSPTVTPCGFCEAAATTVLAYERGALYHACLRCYEQRRALTGAEQAALARREGVPERERGEGTTDYYFRALSTSRPATRGDDDATT